MALSIPSGQDDAIGVDRMAGRLDRRAPSRVFVQQDAP